MVTHWIGKPCSLLLSVLRKEDAKKLILWIISFDGSGSHYLINEKAPWRAQDVSINHMVEATLRSEASFPLERRLYVYK